MSKEELKQLFKRYLKDAKELEDGEQSTIELSEYHKLPEGYEYFNVLFINGSHYLQFFTKEGEFKIVEIK